MAKVRPSLSEIVEEMERGGLLEGSIDTKGFHLAGYCDQATEVISIDPYPELCRAVLHELIHRKHKRLPEARVKEETARLLSSMNTAQVRQFCEDYQQVRRKTRRTIIVEKVD